MARFAIETRPTRRFNLTLTYKMHLQLLYVVLFGVLFRGLGQAQTLSFESSVELSNRKFACPGEVVTYYCVTYGTQLMWEVDEEQISFNRDDIPLNNSRTRNITGNIYWALLNEVRGSDNTTELRRRYCHSMLIVTPGQLDSQNLTLIPCGPQCTESNITCTAVSGSNELEQTQPLTFTHRIAAPPMNPRIQQCSYNRIRKVITVTIEMPSTGDIQTDLDHYKIVFQNESTLTRRVKVTEFEDGNTSLTSRFTDVHLSETVIFISVAAVDKCGQQSSVIDVNCTHLQEPTTMLNPDPSASSSTPNGTTMTSLNIGLAWSLVIGAVVATVLYDIMK